MFGVLAAPLSPSKNNISKGFTKGKSNHKAHRGGPMIRLEKLIPPLPAESIILLLGLQNQVQACLPTPDFQVSQATK